MSSKDMAPAQTKQARERKLAEALRANLRRRKGVDGAALKPVPAPSNDSRD